MLINIFNLILHIFDGQMSYVFSYIFAHLQLHIMLRKFHFNQIFIDFNDSLLLNVRESIEKYE